MKKFISYSLEILLLLIPFTTIAQCILPQSYQGNTGSNMTVMLSTAFITSLDATDENAYLVAFTESGLVIGSKLVFGLSQNDIAVWGDDSQTIEVDGALANEAISFQLVNGTDLYDVVMPSAVSYVGNGLSIQNAAVQLTLVVCESSTIPGCTDTAAINYNMDATEDDGSCTFTVLGCTDATADNYNMDATEDDGSCIFEVYWPTDIAEVNTGANSTYLVQSSNLDGTPLVFGYVLGAFYTNDEGNLKCGGFANCSSSQHAISVWGDDVLTPTKDGFSSGDTITWLAYNNSLDQTYNASIEATNTTANIYTLNTVNIVTAFNVSGSISGCNDTIACNFNTNATEDDGSCEYPAENLNCDGTCIDTDGDAVCDLDEVSGCSDSLALNYNMDATEDDGSCEFDEPEAEGCDLPVAFEGNTGSNMTVMLTTAFITSLDATDENAYLVALTESGLVVGSEAVYGVTQTSLVVWGNDSQTIEVDGALANEAISFQLVNGTDLYDVVMPSAVTYVGNGLSIQNAAAQSTLVVCESSTILGCMDATADNYNMDATEDDGSCTYTVLGCMDANADNYNMDATEDDGSCTYTVLGCTDASAFNYNMDATEDDGSCIAVIEGCTDVTALNYNEFANTDDGSCERLGCMAEWADNFDPQATQEDGSCYKSGCIEEWADNYDPQATLDDGSCYKYGCTADWADNFDPFATLSTSDFPETYEGNTGSNMTVMLTTAIVTSLNATDENAYLVALNQDGLVIGSEAVYGVSQAAIAVWGDDSNTPETDGAAANESISFQLVNGTKLFDVSMPLSVAFVANGLVVQPTAATLTLASGDDDECYRFGCTAEWADNFDELATDDDGSCERLGCMAEWADNFDNLATIDDGSCYKSGCIEEWADNFDPQANQDDGSCYKYGCMADWADNFDPFATLSSSELPETYEGNTGSNMTVLLTTAVVTSLNATDENAYLVALNQNGLVVGSKAVYGVSQTALAVWGDDSQTTELDGAVADETISFQLVNGTDLYNVEMPTAVSFVGNGLSLQNGAATLTLASGDECYRFGCTAEWADNFDELATDDDGSCERLGCMADWADNFDNLATIDDGSCDRLGCMDELDCNYDLLATTQDSSCIGYPGCTEEFYVEYNPQAGCHAEYLCQTSWLEAFDSLEIVSNQLKDENSTYLDSIGLLNLNYQDLVQEFTEDVEVLTTSLDSVEAVVGSLNGELETLENLNVDILAENSSYLDSIQDLAYDVLELQNEILENTIQTTNTLDSLEESLEQISIELVECNSPIQIDLQTGWNMIGYTFKEPQDVVASFIELSNIIQIVKDNEAEVYWPEFGFNGIGDLIPGQGYQVKLEEAYEGFYFPDVDGQRFDLVPTVPQWAINMQVESHPNDIRTLVRVVNMLGQEVNPKTEPKGTVLLYLYNDATVEKKLTK